MPFYTTCPKTDMPFYNIALKQTWLLTDMTFYTTAQLQFSHTLDMDSLSRSYTNPSDYVILIFCLRTTLDKSILKRHVADD